MARYQKEIFRSTKGLKDMTGKAVSFNDDDLEQIVDNFYAGVDNYGPGKTWVPYSHAAALTADPRDNTGYVQELEHNLETHSLFATIDIIDEEADKKVKDNLVRDVSVGLIKTKNGWVLQHVALTMDPAVPNLGEFVQASHVFLSRNLQPFAIVANNDTSLEGGTVVAEQVTEMIPYTIKEQVEKSDAEGELWDVLYAFESAARNIATCQDTEEWKVEKMGALIDELKGYISPLLKKFSTPESAPAEQPAEGAAANASKESIAQKTLRFFGLNKDAKAPETQIASLTAAKDEALEEVIRLNASLEEANTALVEIRAAKERQDWDTVFNSYVGKKVVPAEKELLFERTPDAKALEAELKARADIVDLTKSLALGAELQATAKRDDRLGMLNEDEVLLFQRNGWLDQNGQIVAGKEKYVELALKTRESEIVKG